MDKIKVIHDTVGHTLTEWLGEPSGERICEETVDEVVLRKDESGRLIGFEVLPYPPLGPAGTLAVETVVHSR